MVIIYDTSLKVNFKSHVDAKATTVRLKWKPTPEDDFVICEKTFNKTSQIKIEAFDVWQGYTIPIRTEIFITMQSRNGNIASAWSLEGSFYLDPSDDFSIEDGYIEIDERGEIIFSEFEEVV